MSKLLVAAAIPLFTGCAYLGARGNDLGDIVRLEGSVGAGLQAHVNAGDLLHAGLGSSRRWNEILPRARVRPGLPHAGH